MTSLISKLTGLILVLFSGIAVVHEGAGITGEFISGFFHPLLGWDHVVAMVAVGLWGAFLGAPAIYILPLVIAFGGALGVLGVPVPAIETGIATSAVVLGAIEGVRYFRGMVNACRTSSPVFSLIKQSS